MRRPDLPAQFALPRIKIRGKTSKQDQLKNAVGIGDLVTPDFNPGKKASKQNHLENAVGMNDLVSFRGKTSKQDQLKNAVGMGR